MGTAWPPITGGQQKQKTQNIGDNNMNTSEHLTTEINNFRTGNTQYMSNPSRVESVVTNFMNTTLRELLELEESTHNCYIDNILIGLGLREDEELSKEQLDMKYIELACLINSTYIVNVIEQMAYYQYMAYFLMSGEHKSLSVKMFMAVPLRSFYFYLDSISDKPGLLKQLKYITEHCTYSDGYTIGDFIKEKYAIINQPWWIGTPLEEFRQSIADSCMDIGKLLFDSFQEAFSKQYPICSVHEKYIDDIYELDNMELIEFDLPDEDYY